MRWIYFNPNDPREAADHHAMLQRIDDWWREFGTKVHDLEELFKGRANWDMPGWMSTQLKGIQDGLMWEYCAGVQGSHHRLIITPESDTYLRPMVKTLIERAPRTAGWEFRQYRSIGTLTTANEMVKARAKQSLSGTFVSMSCSAENRIDLCFHSPTTRDPDDVQARTAALVATETLLGEEVLDKWIGVLAVARLAKTWGISNLLARKKDPALIPLDRFKPTVDALLAAINEQLPSEPLFQAVNLAPRQANDAVGAVFQLKPQPSDDYWKWDDLLVASAADKKLWLALHDRLPFYSVRFSRHGETFCYLKIDGSQRLNQDKSADRYSIESALDEVLIPARAGCVVSGGTGLRYSYIDLALSDIDAAIPLIQKRLRDGNIPRRSWLLFFDAPLAHEWIGIYDDSPPPPGL